MENAKLIAGIITFVFLIVFFPTCYFIDEWWSKKKQNKK